MTRYVALPILLLTALPTVLSAQDEAAPSWIPILETARGPTFLDTHSVIRSGSRVSAIIRTERRVIGNNGENRWMERYEFDCNAHTSRVLGYWQIRPDMSMADASDHPEAEPHAIAAGTVGEAVYDRLCR